MSPVTTRVKARRKVKTENKGVTATVTDINDSLSSQQHDIRHQKNTNDLQHVRDELRNVIELMGPSTPHLTLNSSSEADNEESYVTSTSIYSSVLEVKRINTKTEDTTTTNYRQSCDTPRDISQISALPPDSEINDPFVFQNERVISNSDPRAHYFSCPCREYAKNLQEFRSYPGLNMFNAKENCTIIHKEERNDKFNIKLKTMNLLSIFKFRRTQKDIPKEAMDLYKINILQPKNESEHSPPARLVFDRVEDIPKPEMNTVATNTSLIEKKSDISHGPREMPGLPGVPTPFHSYIAPPKFPSKQRNQHIQTNKINNPIKNNTTKFDVYYFDHGDSAYFKTTDCTPTVVTEVVAEKTQTYTSRFWAETFGTIHIAFAFFTAFFLQLLKFILQSLIRPLTVGVTQLMSDYFFKPCLAVIFNGIIQPPLVFLYNIATSIRDLVDPIAEGIGYFLRELANVCKAMRIIEVNPRRQELVQMLSKRKKSNPKRSFKRIV